MGRDTELPTAAGHPFYRRLNELLREHGFDDFVEAQCAGFYAETMGRPGLPPGIYFCLLLIGYFEGIDSERGIAWRAADSLALPNFLGVGIEEDLERPCAHLYETGGLRRAHVRGHENVLKRLLIHASAFNLGLWMRSVFGISTPRSLQGRVATFKALLSIFWNLIYAAIAQIRNHTTSPEPFRRSPDSLITCA